MRMIYLRHQGNNILKGPKGIIYFEEMTPVGNDKSRFSWYNVGRHYTARRSEA